MVAWRGTLIYVKEVKRLAAEIGRKIISFLSNFNRGEMTAVEMDEMV